MLRDAAQTIIKALLSEKDFLNELDEKIGDGDHGLNMAGGAQAAREVLDEADDTDPKKFLQAIGDAVIMNVGGTAGPLYGAALLEISKVVDKNSALNAETLEKIFGAAVNAIQKRGNAQRGDKTMLDVLIPIHESFLPENCAGKTLDEIFIAARDAARNGLEFTKTIAANKGRAASLGKKSIGYEDPGAASSLIIFRAFYGFCKDNRLGVR